MWWIKYIFDIKSCIPTMHTLEFLEIKTVANFWNDIVIFRILIIYSQEFYNYLNTILRFRDRLTYHSSLLNPRMIQTFVKNKTKVKHFSIFSKRNLKKKKKPRKIHVKEKTDLPPPKKTQTKNPFKKMLVLIECKTYRAFP